jgi:phosphonate transport system substrate-binding protein
LLDPETLIFGVLGPDLEKEQERWGDFIVHLENTTGKKIQLESMETTSTALAEVSAKASLGRTPDVRQGKLHIVSMNTGAVPLYVNEGGVVPLCVMAQNDGSFGYKMKIIVSSKSSITQVKDLQGHRFTFSSLHSHSGFHAPLATLWKEFNLRPERDYSPVFAGNQESIIQMVGKGEIVAAAVASDLLQRLEARGDINKDDYRSLYQSKTFPPACYGYSHRLAPELADKVKAAFLEFKFAGTSLEKAYGPAGQTKFVPIVYKADWASVLETNEFVSTLLKSTPSATKNP